MSGQNDPREAADLSALVVGAPTNLGKIRRHVEPLASVTDGTTMVCVTPSGETRHLRYRTVPSPGNRYVGVGLLAIEALREGWRREYDVVVSFSLFPYGLYALVLGTLLGLPTHLAVLGIDVDHHARTRYGALVRAAFRRFDVVSVPGSTHRRALIDMGVDEDRTAVLANAIDTDHFRPAPTDEAAAYEFVWVGRFSEEKHPLLFVRALATLDRRDVRFRAAMVGEGPLEEAVFEEIRKHRLEDRVDLPGWVDDPLPYYRRAETFVLTSRRDALPLTLLEAMATGCASVVRPVGSVTDVAIDGETALVVEETTPTTLADALERLLTDDALVERLAENAVAVGASYSYEAAAEDWREILAKARSRTGPEQTGHETEASAGEPAEDPASQ